MKQTDRDLREFVDKRERHPWRTWDKRYQADGSPLIISLAVICDPLPVIRYVFAGMDEEIKKLFSYINGLQKHYDQLENDIDDIPNSQSI